MGTVAGIGRTPSRTTTSRRKDGGAEHRRGARARLGALAELTRDELAELFRETLPDRQSDADLDPDVDEDGELLGSLATEPLDDDFDVAVDVGIEAMDAEEGSDDDDIEISRWDLVDDQGLRSGARIRKADVEFVPGRGLAGTWRARLLRPCAVAVTGEYPASLVSAAVQLDESLLRIADAIAKEQAGFLNSLDHQELKPISQTDIARMARVNKATVSRMVGKRYVRLPDGTVVLLADLMPDAHSVKLVWLIRWLREHDDIAREGNAVEVRSLIPLRSRSAGDTSLTGLLQKKFGKSGNSASSIANIMSRAGIPEGLETRKRAYERGEDWWS